MDKLHFHDFGDLEGFPIFYSHGTPSCHVEGECFDTLAKKEGYRLLAIDRPGVGLSPYLPNFNYQTYASHVEVIAETLKIDTFGLMGWSGGGAPALSCAHHFKERAKFCVILGGLTPLTSALLVLQLPRIDRIAYKFNKAKFSFFFWAMKWLVERYPLQYLKLLKEDLCPADCALLEEPNHEEFFIRTQTACYQTGYKGVAQDAQLAYGKWGFVLEEISTPVALLHGTDDTLVPFEFAKQNQKLLPNATLHPLEKEGHFFPLSHQRQIFDVIKQLI